MGILDEDIEAVENRQSGEEFKEAIREFGEPTEHEFACYQNAITTLARRTNNSEYDTFMSVEDGEIIDLLTDEGIEDDRAEDILDQCAQRWKPRDLSKS
jgi:hypothetical protein